MLTFYRWLADHHPDLLPETAGASGACKQLGAVLKPFILEDPVTPRPSRSFIQRLIETDDNSRIIYTTPEAAELFGKGPRDLVGGELPGCSREVRRTFGDCCAPAHQNNPSTP